VRTKLAHGAAPLEHGDERSAVQALVHRQLDDAAAVHEGELAVQGPQAALQQVVPEC